MSEAELLLRSAYRAFNARDVEAAIELMDPEVDWPNAWEGGRVVGHAAVRDYWSRQFAAISSKVEPEGFTEEVDGSITVDVHQVVHDVSSGQLTREHELWRSGYDDDRESEHHEARRRADDPRAHWSDHAAERLSAHIGPDRDPGPSIGR